MTTSFSLRTLSRDDILHHLSALSDILASCVNGGASVSFMLPFSLQTATTFWQRTADSVAAGERPVGTVQLIISQPENQPHRADVAKLLVHQNARRQGIANALMAELEQTARREGKTVLVLDTATGSGAEQFYVRCGWEKVGEIPRYALMPDGKMTATSLFYKFLP
ncbi:TPA: GNAT family N-acetyltransferase [Klebsiella quasipneumoniae subsp. similipneumoniae]|nr:GNAT family N-acetyltransferase [Klebsiella quasipneumoniae subsp. similipneumoniae]